MSDIQLSRPVVIALIGAVLLGGFVLLRGGSGEELPPPSPAPAVVTEAPTGATGPSADPTQTVAQQRRSIKREQRAKIVADAKAAGMPTPVYTALKDDKIVMIFFWEPSAKDDQRVNDSIKNLQKLRGSSMVVFREEVANKSKYDGIAQAAEITQSPGIIILYKDEADTAQGYIDSTALNTKITRLTGDDGG